MGQIQVKFDNNLKQSDIYVPISDVKMDTHEQTEIYGIIHPIIQLNNIFIEFNDVLTFELKSTSEIPSVKFTAHDRQGMSATLDTNSPDNELRIQILPAFENAYKKINMTFLVTKLSITDGIITCSGSYKCPKLFSSQFKSFGEICSYKLFENIAKETQLGFATNTENNDKDKRYIYCNHISYADLLKNEIQMAYSDKNTIYDWWIDYWNNINFVNIYERYNTIDPDKDLIIWTIGQYDKTMKNTKPEPEPMVATIHNNPILSNHELFSENYKIINRIGSNITAGTDKVFSVYEDELKEYKDHLIMDGDVKEDVYENYEYLGEVFGDYNYLLAKKLKETYMQKMGMESIKVTLKSPTLSLMRGFKVNLVWYVNNDNWENTLNDYENYELINKNVSTNIPLEDNTIKDTKNSAGKFIIDKSISGQYMINGCNIKYDEGEWAYDLILNRPYTQKPELMKKTTNLK